MSHRHPRILRFLVASATLVGAIYLFAAPEPRAERNPDRSEPKRVRVAQVEQASESRALRFSGVTRAVRRARLGFAVGGRLVERPVDVGDRVTEGQVLARVDDREVRNALASARGALAEVAARRSQAERDVERVAELVAAKAATPEELEKTRAALAALEAAEEAARARLEETRRLLEETSLQAPYAGTVLAVLVEPGEHVVPGQPVVSVSGRGELELEVEVPESVVLHLQEGASVDVVVPFLGRTVEATLHSVGRSAGGPGRLFPVVARIQGAAADELVAGATAELALTLATDDALAVPVSAVINPGGRSPAVFRLVGEKVEKVSVEVGNLLTGAAGDLVTVTPVAGFELEAGDRVVVGGQRGLLDGEQVDSETDSETETETGPGRKTGTGDASR